MEYSTVVPDSSYVVDFAVGNAYFGIYYGIFGSIVFFRHGIVSADICCAIRIFNSP